MKRFLKQIKLEGFGQASQDKLTLAKVLVIGAGGLGCPAITYLASAGIGTLGIMDHDLVEETNLHRQPMYTVSDIGKPKVLVSASRARELNPEAQIITWQERITPANALAIITDFDLVLDCTDNYEARYLINDACVILDKPWIYGAVEAWEGQVSVFNALLLTGKKTPTYRCIFPEAALDALNCNDVGVIGTMPGSVGLLQANEAIKLITGIGKIQDGLLLIDLLHNNFQKIMISRDDDSISRITSLNPDYSGLIEFSHEIDHEEINRHQDDFIILDIREKDELEEYPFTGANFHVPMMELINNGFPFLESKTYVLACASGRRSLKTIYDLKPKYPGVNLLSLRGGVKATL